MQSASLLYNLISLGGILIICGLAFLSSHAKKKIRWSTAAWAVGLQLVMGCFVFVVPAGREALLGANKVFLVILDSARAGVEFLFGPLSIGPGHKSSVGFILAIQALPTIIFFMALTAGLYQLGIMQRVVKLFSRLFVRTMGVSGAESLSVASNIFVGVESAGMVRPFLPDFTRSEFFCILTAAMATVASSTMGVYVMTLSHIMPNIAGHLMSASIISAPAAICVAKIMEPETGEPLTMGKTVDPETGKYSSFMEAVVQGSNDGVKLVIGVMALLLSFLGLVSLVNHVVSWFGGLGGLAGLNLETILGYLGWPLALIMGVPAPDAAQVGQLLGQRILVTEIPAYTQLAQLAQNGGISFDRSILVASYALCGFTHVGSVAIYVGGFGALAPGRMGELSRLGFKALWAATLTTCMTGCIAGLFAFGAETVLKLTQ
ncbi:NupC/NupG family nucleoside CNT transporter [Dethiosulfatarculus sandiegensis]|uniref:Nucleoside transporter n=1 Tax=Dethiosulfatarculus sandiegensis TaxID=1429043 RepID=A0A0D2J9K9_9BACT|nr:nucleoside transporter C-terminal domain-containing protein [Dethiosulfatarculus sandiegensis]KIX14824.1 hypothetical protein X474_06675 [Dethiosulfatarculus sandiegensis]